MEHQNQALQEEQNHPKDKTAVVQDSVNKLKEKVKPGVKATLLLAEAFHLAMLIIGAINVHNCPVNKYIPVFLIVIGCIGLVSKFVSYMREKIAVYTNVVYIESALYTAELIFFLLGNYWVYKEFQPSYEPESGPAYCNKTAYLFAFVYITLHYVFLIALLVGFCCFICCAFLMMAISTRADSGDPEAPSPTNETVQPLAPKPQ